MRGVSCDIKDIVDGYHFQNGTYMANIYRYAQLKGCVRGVSCDIKDIVDGSHFQNGSKMEPSICNVYIITNALVSLAMIFSAGRHVIRMHNIHNIIQTAQLVKGNCINTIVIIEYSHKYSDSTRRRKRLVSPDGPQMKNYHHQLVIYYLHGHYL